MKKFLSILLIVVLLVSLAVSLIACDSDELKGLTYTDENGNEVTVKKIKKTDDPETVAADIMALASKEENIAALTQLLITLDVNGSIAGTQGETAFDNNVNANVQLGIACPADKNQALSDFLEASKIYLKANITGKAPKTIPIDDDALERIDFTETANYNEQIEAFIDEYEIYTKLALSEDAAASLSALIPSFADVNNKVGVVTGIPGGAPTIKYLIAAKLDSKIDLGKAFTDYNSWLKGGKAIAEAAEDDDEGEGEATTEESTVPEYTEFQTLVNIVKIFHIQITKTKGSVVTFEAAFNADSVAQIKALYGDKAAEEFSEFNGSVTATLELDAKTMMDFTLTLNCGDLLKEVFQDEVAEGTTITSTTASITLSVSTQTTIPTLTDAEKEGATALDIGALVSMLIK